MFKSVLGTGVAVVLIKALITFAVSYVVIAIFVKIVKRMLNKSKLDESTHKFMIRIVKIVLWVIAAVVIMGELGVSTAPLVTVIAACGAAIALALKDSLANVAGGIIIMYTKVILNGEYIKVVDIEGTVMEIDMFSTIIRSIDNSIITIPNDTIIRNPLINYSREDRRRVDIRFEVGYNADIAKARDVICRTAKACDKTDLNTEPEVVVGMQKDQKIQLDARVWCSTKNYWSVYYYMKEQVKVALDKEGIDKPYPHIDIDIKANK